MSLTCGVTSESTIATAFEQTIARFGTVDVLINNAAMRQRDLFPPHGAAAILDAYDEHWQRMFDVNVFGVLKVIRQFCSADARKAAREYRERLVGRKRRSGGRRRGVGWPKPGLSPLAVRCVEGSPDQHEFLSRG
jgi:NAD(P)-dependent dehydrogenase (short-subunit alcohol dehydrogenase family)